MANQVINVLLIEDESLDCHVKKTLSGCYKTVKFDTEPVKDLSDAIELLGRKSFDVILLNLEFPGGYGIDTVKKIHALNSNIPIVVITGLDDEQIGLQAIKNGADDYLIRGKIFQDVLERSIRYAIERRYARRRAEQKQAQLLRKLESANQELKDFAYIISHDLKAPLRGINSLVNEVLTDYADKVDRAGSEKMKLLLGRVDRMHSMIDGVLQYSKIGLTRKKQALVDLNKLIPQVIDMLAPPENIEITVEDQLPVIVCEETCIIQVFQNLLSNAIKYMDKPQGRIKVACAENNNFWEFRVEDNGPGIEEKNFEKIFQIFQTLAPRDKVESTGVGLAVVKKIVEMNRGRVWVESEVGKGSTFFFRIPKRRNAAEKGKLLQPSAKWSIRYG